MQKSPTTIATTLSIALMIGLAGCSQTESQTAATDGQTSTTSPTEATSSQIDAAPLSLDDAWVKAADDGMTAVFGQLKNGTDKDITLVEAKYDDAEMVQLHETVEDDSGAMSMQEKKGGFVIPAVKSLTLEPGGDHIMVMGLKKPIKPGEEISLELVTDDDQTVEVSAVAKEYSGAQESYGPGAADAEGSNEGTDHEDMDHEDMDHGDH